MFSLKTCRRSFGFRPAAAPHPDHARPLAAAVTAIVLALIASVASDVQAASAPLGSALSNDQEIVQPNPADSRKTTSGGLSRVDPAAGDAVAEQIFQSEFMSARSVATFARSAKPLGVLMSESFSPVFAPGGFDTGPKGLSGRGLYNTITTLHGPRPTRGSWAGADSLDTVVAESSTASAALAQFWEQSASADFVFDQSGSDAGANAAGVGAANVLIPLPAAAWSALSVMGGVGIFAGIRRAFRRSR